MKISIEKLAKRIPYPEWTEQLREAFPNGGDYQEMITHCIQADRREFANWLIDMEDEYFGHGHD